MERKPSTINLIVEDCKYLEIQTCARILQAQTVKRSRIPLLKTDGFSIGNIADKVGVNRKSGLLCLKNMKKSVWKTH